MLIVLQAMDAGGKDGTIRHVMRGVNPQGCSVTSFKAPTPEELAHDFLWRVHRHTPAKGLIAVFNRSHYGDVLIVRVLKLFLHISADEQRKRLEARPQDPRKCWESNPEDLKEREQWSSYMAAYEDAFAKCSTEHAPWHIIPANRKWYRNLVLAELVAETLEEMNPQWPKPACDLEGVVVQ